jgi:hypothetical protein
MDEDHKLPFRVYTICFAPCSHNQAYGTQIRRKGRKHFPVRYLQPDYRAFKEAVKFSLLETDACYGGPLPFKPPFALTFLFLMEHSSFFYKKGTWRRRDVSDFFKLVEDACSEHWGHDDKFNLVVTGQKRCVPDGTLTEFIPDAYKSPPHKDLVGIIKIVIRPLPEDFVWWDGNLIPELPKCSIEETNLSTTP